MNVIGMTFTWSKHTSNMVGKANGYANPLPTIKKILDCEIAMGSK